MVREVEHDHGVTGLIDSLDAAQTLLKAVGVTGRTCTLQYTASNGRGVTGNVGGYLPAGCLRASAFVQSVP